MGAALLRADAQPMDAATRGRHGVDELCEVWFTIMALVWITQMMAPSARRLAAGYGQGKPTSGLLAIYAYRRVMRDCARYVPEMAETLRVLKGICARYKLRWGDDAFVVTRKQPFATAHIAAIMAALTSVAGPSMAAVLRAAITTAFCYAMSTGARKDEWTLVIPRRHVRADDQTSPGSTRRATTCPTRRRSSRRGATGTCCAGARHPPSATG